MDLGFINAGFKIIWAIDNNKDAVKTYKTNIGDHILCDDITKIDPKDIPKADVVIGGPPCQSFSLSGKRNVEDARGQLVWRYLDIIKEINPKAFVFENVTGLMSAKNGNGERIVDLLKIAFSEIGYSIALQIMNAAEYGVPQKRKRVIIVGKKQGQCYHFPKPTHGTEKNLEPFISVKDALDDLPIPQNDDQFLKYRMAPQNEYQCKMRSSNVVDGQIMPTMSDLDQYIIKNVPPGGNYKDIPSGVKSQRIRRLQKEGGHTTCYGRMDPEKPSYTVNTYFNRPNVGCNIHYSQDRLITVREAMRLQSFPDSYRIASNSKQGKCLIVGNAVPPLLAYVVAEELKKEIEAEYHDTELH